MHSSPKVDHRSGTASIFLSSPRPSSNPILDGPKELSRYRSDSHYLAQRPSRRTNPVGGPFSLNRACGPMALGCAPSNLIIEPMTLVTCLCTGAHLEEL